jgi:hypothetical protein
MKDKKDGKNRGLYTNGCPINQNNSPLATSTAEKDDLIHRSYDHHHHHNYYHQPTMMSATYQTQVAYNPHLVTDTYEISTNYSMKQSNYYTPPPPPTSYDNYYFHSQNSTINH